MGGGDASSSEIVIVGGGAVGCGVAYSLARAGKTDVLVLEREPSVAASTTSRAAGLVGQVRTTVERTRLAMSSVQTFSGLEEETGVSPGWRQVGSLRLALTDERVAEFERMKAVADEADLRVEWLDRDRAARMWPGDFSRVAAVLWCPTDGHVQPYDLTMAYCKYARDRGARVATGVTVREVVVRGGRVVGVETDRGRVDCDVVVNAAGAHAYHVARSAGLELPIVPVRHEFFVTVDVPGMKPDLPVVRIPDSTLYLRAEVNALLVGGWEPRSLSADPRAYDLEAVPEIDDDWDVLAGFGDLLAPEFPAVREAGIRSVFKGWPTFTPDGKFIVGESSRVRGFVMAGGCNAHGVSGSAGIGRHVVESMLESEPSEYVRSLSPDRFDGVAWDWESARREAQRRYERYYAVE